MSRSFFTPPLQNEASRTSRGERLVDMDTLVWPPRKLATQQPRPRQHYASVPTSPHNGPSSSRRPVLGTSSDRQARRAYSHDHQHHSQQQPPHHPSHIHSNTTSQQSKMTSHAPQQSSYFDTERPFFEPLISTPNMNMGGGYLSAVVDEHGRQINGRTCFVPPELAPGGIVQQGWLEGYVHPLTPPSHVHLNSIAHQAPLHYAPYDEDDESDSDSDFSHVNPGPTRLPTSPTPTRLGYWNRRGDTIGPNGYVRPAPSTQMYPPDLAHYPEYALMNEVQDLTLPATEYERVVSWRKCT